MKKFLLFSLSLFCPPLARAATTVVVLPNPTPTQAVLLIKTDQGSCSVKLSLVNDFSGAYSPAIDVDTALFSGSDQCNRAYSIDNGASKYLVLGQRSARLALTSALVSRALQANTLYYYRVAAGSDVVLGSFITQNPPFGLPTPELLPADSSGYGGYGFPTPNWLNSVITSTSYIDPQTGIKIVRPLPLGAGGGKSSACFTSIFDVNSAWTNPNNLIGCASTYAGYSGSASDPLYLKPLLDKINFVSNANYSGYYTIDDLDLLLSGCGVASSAADRTISVTLLNHRVAIGNTIDFILPAGTISSGACTSGSGPATSSGRTYPAPLLTDWGAGSLLTSQDLSIFTGTADLSGSTLTWKTGYTFCLCWQAGDKIIWNGAEYTISTVNSAQSITFTTSPTAANDKPFSAGQFEIRIKKKTASTDAISVTSSGNSGMAYAYNAGNYMTADGANDFCSSVPAPGVSPAAHLCAFPRIDGTLVLWLFTPSTGSAIHIGNMTMPSSYVACDGNPTHKDQICHSTTAQNFGMFDESSGDTFYLLAMTGDTNQYFALFKGVVSNFSAWNDGYAAGSENTSAITYTNLTPASQNKDVYAAMNAANPLFDAYDTVVPGGVFFAPVLAAGKLGSKIIVSFGPQNTLGFTGFYDVDANTWIAKESYGAYPGGWGAQHTIEATGTFAHMRAAINPSTTGGITFQMLAVSGGQDGAGALPSGYTVDCAGAGTIDARWQALGAVPGQSHCASVTVDHLTPYNTAPRAREAGVGGKWPCAFNVNYSCPRSLAEGDVVGGVVSLGVGNEKLLVIKIIGSVVWLLRDYLGCATSAYNTLKQAPTDTHAAGWTMVMWPPGACYGTGWWYSLVDGSISLDNPYINNGHMDFGRLGATDAGTFAANGPSVRNGNLPTQISIPSTAASGFPWDFTYSYFLPWGGSTAALNSTIQSHPSYRQHMAPAREQRWILDGNSYSSSGGGESVLWPNTLTNISGNIYKVTLPNGGGQVSTLDRKKLPLTTWAGKYNVTDKSGPGAVLAGGDSFKFCVADLAGVADQCVTGAAQGDIYMNVPQASTSGNCDLGLQSNNPCAITGPSIGGYLNQYLTFDQRYPLARRITSALTSPASLTTYTNFRSDPTGAWGFGTANWWGDIRNELIAALIPPSPPLDNINRSTFIPFPVGVGGVSGDTIRVGFGYGEYGTPSQMYCTSRLEKCYTDASGAAPFVWASETQHYTTCNSGCTVNVPALSGRILYYQIERKNGSTVTTYPLQAAPIP